MEVMSSKIFQLINPFAWNAFMISVHPSFVNNNYLSRILKILYISLHPVISNIILEQAQNLTLLNGNNRIQQGHSGCRWETIQNDSSVEKILDTRHIRTDQFDSSNALFKVYQKPVFTTEKSALCKQSECERKHQSDCKNFTLYVQIIFFWLPVNFSWWDGFGDCFSNTFCFRV